MLEIDWGLRRNTALSLVVAAFFRADASEVPGPVEFSDRPAPLRLDTFPERPPPLLELGDKFLSTGAIQRGYRIPTGAVWSPNLWVFGSLRSAIQTFDSGSPIPASTRVTEWANRLDLFGNLQLSPTERILVGFRPVDQDVTPSRFSGFEFEPQRGFVDAFSATPRTWFFEGEFGELFPKLDPADKRSLDYGFAVGRQPLSVQDGILINDDAVDLISVTRNSLNVPGGSTLKVSSYYGWSQIERGDNQRDNGANLVGINAAADFPVSTVDADLVYVNSPRRLANATYSGGDGLYAGVGSTQRIGKLNTVFRVNTSVSAEASTQSVGNGTLLFAEGSYTPWYGDDLFYLNGFWAVDHFTSADRSPSAGGPLGRVGILNAAVGLGHYGAPLSNASENAAGGAIGYQMFLGESKRRQLILEIGGRAPTRAPILVSQDAAEGVGARYQQAFGRRFVLVLDAFGVQRDRSSFSYGGRVEILVKF